MLDSWKCRQSAFPKSSVVLRRIKIVLESPSQPKLLLALQSFLSKHKNVILTATLNQVARIILLVLKRSQTSQMNKIVLTETLLRIPISKGIKKAIKIKPLKQIRILRMLKPRIARLISLSPPGAVIWYITNACSPKMLMRRLLSTSLVSQLINPVLMAIMVLRLQMLSLNRLVQILKQFVLFQSAA